MKYTDYLVSKGGQFYIKNQPSILTLSAEPKGYKYEIVDTVFKTGKEYDQSKYVNRQTAESLVADYPDIYTIETHLQ